MLQLFLFVQSGQPRSEGRTFFREELVDFLMEERPTGDLLEDVSVGGGLTIWARVGTVAKGKIRMERKGFI